MADDENDPKPSTIRDDLKENHEVNTGFRLHKEGLSDAAIYEHLDKAYERPAMRAMGALDAGRVDPFEQRAAVTEAANMESRNAIPRESHPFDGYPDRDTSDKDDPLPDLDPVKVEGFIEEVREEKREAARQDIASLREAMSGPPPERDETPGLPGVVRKEPEQLALASAVREKPASREFDRW